MRAAIAALALLLAPSAAAAQDRNDPPPENLAARAWFQEAKFGMFIHWGVSSQLMDGEWVMENRHIRIAEYERVAGYFNPVRFDADRWVTIARGAGMRYITLITKHHDGFALFDSRVSDWDVMDRTPFRRKPRRRHRSHRSSWPGYRCRCRPASCHRRSTTLPRCLAAASSMHRSTRAAAGASSACTSTGRSRTDR